ncbi:RHS repeat-associated core domain-containing protein [Pseudomonas sp. PGPR40]|uniref:RHS repeat-associated core domain-containing protein n=1 Tax=Pseudomonas sp. PGPR40 TaxID=2913476 RepID=UPI001EDBDDA6|nr:RHS repeat-associated core domain-containing protein [Pseudomonas sp. PGPR40]
MPASRQPQDSAHPPVADIAFSRTLLLATDLQQSVLAELDRSGPNRLAYTAYGSQSSQRTAGTHLGFNGQLRERPSGWYHLGNGHRVYNPALMQFHSPDRLSPFGKGGVNAYAYCGGDPINFADPSGQFAIISLLIQRLETIALHLGIITATVTTVVKTRPVGLALHAARISLVGSPISIAGAGMQLAGYPVGAIVSNVGTALSVAGVATRTFIGAQDILRHATPWQYFREGVRHIWSGNRPPAPIMTTPTPAHVSIPMESVGGVEAPSGLSSVPKPGSANAIRRNSR